MVQNYVVIIIIFMGFGGVKREEEILKSLFGGGKPRRGDQFLGGELTPLHIMKGVLTM